MPEIDCDVESDATMDYDHEPNSVPSVTPGGDGCERHRTEGEDGCSNRTEEGMEELNDQGTMSEFNRIKRREGKCSRTKGGEDQSNKTKGVVGKSNGTNGGERKHKTKRKSGKSNQTEDEEGESNTTEGEQDESQKGMKTSNLTKKKRGKPRKAGDVDSEPMEKLGEGANTGEPDTTSTKSSEGVKKRRRYGITRDTPLPSASKESRLADGRFICTTCSKTFSCSSNLNKHARTHTGELPYACAQCDHRCVCPNSFQQHMRTHTGEKPFACSHCDRKFTDRSSLVYHQRKHPDKRLFECWQCSKFFSDSHALAQHRATHGVEEPFQCKQCDRRFSNTSALHTHKTAKNCTAFPCSSCDAKFSKIEPLRQHSKRDHGVTLPLPTYACPDCPMTFHSLAPYKGHKRTHQGNPVTCSDCNKTFTQVSGLKRHMLIHSGERRYACPQCKKQFGRSSEMSKHMRIHTGTKPYACTQCNKKFCQSSGLRRHVTTHTDQRPFSCGYCSAKFKCNGSLRLHGRIHTGERPFVCHKCSTGFISQSRLHRHDRTWHKPSEDREGNCRTSKLCKCQCTNNSVRCFREMTSLIANRRSEHEQVASKSKTSNERAPRPEDHIPRSLTELPEPVVSLSAVPEPSVSVPMTSDPGASNQLPSLTDCMQHTLSMNSSTQSTRSINTPQESQSMPPRPVLSEPVALIPGEWHQSDFNPGQKYPVQRHLNQWHQGSRYPDQWHPGPVGSRTMAPRPVVPETFRQGLRNPDQRQQGQWHAELVESRHQITPSSIVPTPMTARPLAPRLIAPASEVLESQVPGPDANRPDATRFAALTLTKGKVSEERVGIAQAMGSAAALRTDAAKEMELQFWYSNCMDYFSEFDALKAHKMDTVHRLTATRVDPAQKYFCEVCCVRFPSAKQLVLHKYDAGHMYQCLCLRAFRDLKDLEEHKHVVHRMKVNRSQINDPNARLQETHKPGCRRLYVCADCPREGLMRVFKEISELNTHRQEHANKHVPGTHKQVAQVTVPELASHGLVAHKSHTSKSDKLGLVIPRTEIPRSVTRPMPPRSEMSTQQIPRLEVLVSQAGKTTTTRSKASMPSVPEPRIPTKRQAPNLSVPPLDICQQHQSIDDGLQFDEIDNNVTCVGMNDEHSLVIDGSKTSTPEVNRAEVNGSEVYRPQGRRSEINRLEVSRPEIKGSQVSRSRVNRLKMYTKEVNGSEATSLENNGSKINMSTTMTNDSKENRADVNGSEAQNLMENTLSACEPTESPAHTPIAVDSLQRVQRECMYEERPPDKDDDAVICFGMSLTEMNHSHGSIKGPCPRMASALQTNLTPNLQYKLHYECCHCSQHFCKLIELKAHQVNTHGASKNKSFTCKINLLLRDHPRHHTQKTVAQYAYKCRVCTAIFGDLNAVQDHRRLLHRLPTYAKDVLREVVHIPLQDDLNQVGQPGFQSFYACMDCPRKGLMKVFHKKDKLDDHRWQEHGQEVHQSIVSRAEASGPLTSTPEVPRPSQHRPLASKPLAPRSLASTIETLKLVAPMVDVLRPATHMLETPKTMIPRPIAPRPLSPKPLTPGPLAPTPEASLMQTPLLEATIAEESTSGAPMLEAPTLQTLRPEASKSNPSINDTPEKQIPVKIEPCAYMDGVLQFNCLYEEPHTAEDDIDVALSFVRMIAAQQPMAYEREVNGIRASHQSKVQVSTVRSAELYGTEPNGPDAHMQREHGPQIHQLEVNHAPQIHQPGLNLRTDLNLPEVNRAEINDTSEMHEPHINCRPEVYYGPRVSGPESNASEVITPQTQTLPVQRVGMQIPTSNFTSSLPQGLFYVASEPSSEMYSACMLQSVMTSQHQLTSNMHSTIPPIVPSNRQAKVPAKISLAVPVKNSSFVHATVSPVVPANSQTIVPTNIPSTEPINISTFVHPTILPVLSANISAVVPTNISPALPIGIHSRCKDSNQIQLQNSSIQLKERMAAPNGSIITAQQNHFCRICSTSFLFEVDLMEHRRARHGYQCRVCAEVFSDLRSLQEHRRIDHKIASQRSWLLGPGANKSEENWLRTNMLDANGLPTNRSVANRLNAKRLGANLTGTRGPVVLGPAAQVSRSIQEAEDALLYSCGVCPEIFETERQLDLHRKTHFKYRCLDCMQEFRGLVRLKVHRQTVHDPASEESHAQYPCTICHKTFSSRLLLNVHRRIQHVYKCTTCPKVFGALTWVKAHGRVAHIPPSRKSGCGRCGDMFETATEAKGCFFRHNKRCDMPPSFKRVRVLLERCVAQRLVLCH